MDSDHRPIPRLQNRNKAFILIIYAFCLLANLSGAILAKSLSLPLFLDTQGTIVASVLGGYLPGIVIGLLTNLLKGTVSFTSVYYATVNVLIAVCSAYYYRRGYFKKLKTAAGFFLVLTVYGGSLSACLTWVLYGFGAERATVFLAPFLYSQWGLGTLEAQIGAELLVNMADKAISVTMALAVIWLLPAHSEGDYYIHGWQQTPLSKEILRACEKEKARVLSLRTKMTLLIILAALGIAVAATGVSLVLFRRSTIEEHTLTGKGAAGLAAGIIDAERVDTYLASGEAAEGYLETEALLYRIRASSPDIEYIYVYQIREDGCHVVFDLDTDDLPGAEPGDVIPFDESFYSYLPALLAGQPIDPIITDDTYGWLLTVYTPVYDANGVCKCYAAADISMTRLRAQELAFFVKEASLFLGFFVLILAAGLWMAKYNVILPVNSMALTAGAFAYNSAEERADSVERIRALNIRTGDEIESLYLAFCKMAEDSIQYVADIQAKSQTISRMQNGLIMVLADMVESRDQNTGDHVRKTAAYTRIIMNELRREGIYTDQLTDEFIENVVNSAPLHDVGKIKVPDAVLNKPGRLDNDEYQTMKCHTTTGAEIISEAIELVSDSDYLEEAKNLAAFHHERWDGNGYPHGLKGEEIPLSARIMAVADVFDALVSHRSYKDGMPVDMALDIIRDGIGTHFDPNVARAFLNAESEVRLVAEKFDEASHQTQAEAAQLT